METKNLELECAANHLAKYGADVYMPASATDPLGQIKNPDPEYLKAPWADPEFQWLMAEKLYAATSTVGRMSNRLAEFERDIEGFQNILGRILKR